MVPTLFHLYVFFFLPILPSLILFSFLFLNHSTFHFSPFYNYPRVCMCTSQSHSSSQITHNEYLYRESFLFIRSDTHACRLTPKHSVFFSQGPCPKKDSRGLLPMNFICSHVIEICTVN